MVAVFNTASACDWAQQIGDTPWPLLPVANRPLLDYWLEACTELGIGRVHIILGEGAKQIEDFVGSGERWNVEVEYAFARPAEDPLDYLKAISGHWAKGLFYIGGPFFLRRRQAYVLNGLQGLRACRHDFNKEALFVYGPTSNEVNALLENPLTERGLEEVHIHPYAIGSIRAYFALNMKMVEVEYSRYVTAGYSSPDGSSIGYNVRTPPSSHLQSPILVGNDCRFGALTTVGPNAVIANHVIVDAHSELVDCLILDDTYIGRNLEIHGKIVSGNRVIDPSDGTVIQIDDSWLVAHNRPDMRTEDIVRCIILWFCTLGLVLVQLIPFCMLLPLILLSRVAGYARQLFHDPHTGYIILPVFVKYKDRKSTVYRLFLALSLDKFPLLLRALRGKLFLCGQPPMRHPEDDALIKQLPH
ncbi:MAG: NDP-sugar synthase, partial [Kiritimatiellales bacterium]|nr:NDP-sugar synthase [Kiritimatiellales bacterium]